MLKILSIIYMLGYSNQQIKLKTDPCEHDYNKLPIDKRIELAIGCSTVSGQRVYGAARLAEIIKSE